MPIQFLDDAEPQVRFTDDMEGGTTGHVRFLDEPAPAIAPQVEEQQLKSLTVDQFEALSPHEKARKMSRLEEVQFAPVSILSPKRGESRDVARERQSRALAEEQLKIEQDAAPHNLREHVELARARPSGKAQYWLDRMMFSPTKGAQSLEVLNSAKNISAGVADAKDYEEVSGYLVASERAKEQGIAADVGDLLSAMPAYMAEFAMTGGAYSGTKAAVQRAGLVAVEQAVSKAVARNVGSRLARGAINRAVQAPATAIGIGAQVAANPQQIANNLADHELSGLTFQKGDEGTIETVLKQDDKGFLTNLRNAYVKAGFELGSERAGELLTPLKAAIARRWLGVPGRTPGKLKAALDSAGWHGVIGEMFEERVNELGAPLYGENYQPPTWRQLTTEAIAFSVPGAVNRLTSGKVAEKGTDATTTRTADEVLDGGPTATGVPADGTDRANAPTVVEPRPPDSQRGGAPGAVGAVVPPEVAPGQVASEPPKPQRVDVPGIGAVNIQYPAGSIRSGKDKGGNEWQVTMPAHYGDIVGTKGKDKDRIDIYVGPNAQSPGSVAIVNQINPETGKFDEHKVLAGFTSLPEAVAAYDAAFSDGSGPARRQSVETFSPEQFQTWLKEGDHSKPAARAAPVEEPPAPPVIPPVTKPVTPEPKPAVPETIPPVAETKAPTPLVLWGRKGPTDPWVKLTDNTSNAEMARRQKDGWQVLRHPKGSSPNEPISPPAATPAGAPPVVDVTAKPSATRTPEAGAVETQAKIDDIRKRREEIKARLRKKFGQTNVGVDPEIATIAAELAVNYAEEGVVRFSDFARRVKDDLPEIWERLKHYLGGAWRTAGEQNMELDEVNREQGKAAIQSLDAEVVKEPLPKEEGVKPPEVNQPTKKEGEENIEVGIIPLVWDQAISIAQGVIRAGGKVADAVAKAIAYIRANHKGAWDEAGARAALETASAEPAATEQGVTEPAEGEPTPAVDDNWVETKVKGVSWWVRDRDRLTPESTERSIAAAEAAFTEAGFESERRTMFDQGDHQTKSILFIPETEDADAKGRKLAAVLEREIQTQREEGKGADHVSTLINSVREGFDQPKSAFRQMSAQVRNRLFALAQEEASWRGRALRALANSKADLIRVSRNVDVYLQRIYSKAFSEDPTSETAKELEDALREVLSEEEIQKLKDLVQDPAHRDRIKAALKRALAKVAPKGNRRFGRKNWRTIETLIEGGILDDTEWFKELARKRGWKVPTDAEIEQMRRLADEEQALRQPTDAELAKAGDDPLARERLLADIEAATRESRFRLQKRLAVMWSEMTKPVSMRHYWTQRQNNARFLNELMTANILFRASFVGKQAIDISTQWFWRMPMRAFAQAFNLRRNDLAAGRQTRFWDDSQASLKDIYGDSIKSLKVAASKARAALAGHVEIRNVDRLMGSVSALDRLWLRADRAAEDGRPAEAFMWRAVAAIGFSYKVAGAFDYLHGTPAEWNERRSRVIEALRETGADPAAARVQADWVMNGALAEYPEAVAMTRSMLEARGIPFTEQQLRENAWNMVERRQYQRINELGLPVDAIQEQAEFYRQTLGWNEREMRGLGGVVGGVVSAIGRGFEQVGIPLAMGRFGNAIAIGINRQLHRTPLYKLADLAFMPGSAQQPSAWSRTMTDIYERRLEAIAGTMLGSLVLSAAAFGLWKVWLKPPPDKEERELWEREGHKAGTVEIPLGDGRFSVWSLTTGPFALVAPYLAAGGAINDLTVKREKAQAKLDADAARRGLTPAKLPPPDISDWFGVAAQAAQGSILGQRTASGLFYSVTDYGTPNVKKFVASQFTPLVPGLPALQEVSRMSGVIIDPKKADVLDFLVPLPTSKARKYNMIGDPVGTPDDVQRVIQTLTGGSYPVITPGAAREADAYKALFATGYRPPSIDPNAGRAIGGDFRPFTGSELERYTEARSKNLRQELGRLGPEANLKDAREAYQRANTAALREVGVTVAPRAETSAGGRAGRGTAPPGRTGGVPLATESRSGSVGGAVRRGIRRGRLSRGLRGVRFGRRGLSRASRIRLQPRLGRGRRRGLSRARRVSFARA